MNLYTLKLIATVLFLLKGSIASFSILVMNLEGDRLLLASIISLGCIPLCCFMIYDMYLESKFESKWRS